MTTHNSKDAIVYKQKQNCNWRTVSRWWPAWCIVLSAITVVSIFGCYTVCYNWVYPACNSSIHTTFDHSFIWLNATIDWQQITNQVWHCFEPVACHLQRKDALEIKSTHENENRRLGFKSLHTAVHFARLYTGRIIRPKSASLLQCLENKRGNIII